jgi:hypothetical protein
MTRILLQEQTKSPAGVPTTTIVYPTIGFNDLPHPAPRTNAGEEHGSRKPR